MISRMKKLSKILVLAVVVIVVLMLMLRGLRFYLAGVPVAVWLAG